MERKVNFAPGEYYHIYSRTIFSIPEFKDPQNANKLAQNFILANSTNSSKAFDYLRNTKYSEFDRAIEIAKEGEKFVDIICYAIMPNHYHLLLKELRENGISDFILRSNTSTAKYINTKNNRKGPLFESRFNAKHINSNGYLLALSVYIHLNPLDFLSGMEWRENSLKNWVFQKKKLLSYPYSSINAYMNKNFEDPIISGTEIVLDQFGNGEDYEQFLRQWCEEGYDFDEINELLLE